MSISRDFEAYLASLSSRKFRCLWPSQTYVLGEYQRAYATARDLAIELPTGAGKTLIALLLAAAWRDTGKKVAILSANKTLARQMHAEAHSLGIPSILMEGRGPHIPARALRAYQRSQAIAIMNYWVYFNQNPIVDPADLLVMDDAHLAEHCLNSLYSVEITRYSHLDLFTSLVTELYQQLPDYAILLDALNDEAPPNRATELLSFIDQVAIIPRLREIVDASPSLIADVDLNFRWQRMRQNLAQANVYCAQNAIWIRPYIFPLVDNQHYAGPAQVLYFSATIGEPGDLSRRLGTRPIVLMPVPSEHRHITSGRRLIVMNRLDGEEHLAGRLGRGILAALRVRPKSLWLCSSEAEARRRESEVSAWLAANGLAGQPTWILRPLGDEIEHFKAAPTGHLFVAGRFDGMDFSGDECRVVVVTTLPRAINLQEEFLAAYLRDASFMRRRLNQRVVQALGRCNRGADDYAVYFLADQRFAAHFGRESNRQGLPPNMEAEIDMAQDLAELGPDELEAKVTGFLESHFQQFDAELQQYMTQVPPARPAIDRIDTSADEVLGWTALFASHNCDAAEAPFERCWRAARGGAAPEVAALHGWTLAKALYLQHLLGDAAARERSLATLEEAINWGGKSSWFNRMRASLRRARRQTDPQRYAFRDEYAECLIRAFDDRLERTGTRGARYQRWLDNVTAALTSTSHAQYQEGLECLGGILGYAATRSKRAGAADCEWRGIFGNTREVVTFEAKIEHEPNTEISASDVGQAHNQHVRAVSEDGALGYGVRSVIVTDMTSLHADALASLGAIRILPKGAVCALWQRVAAILTTYRGQWSLDDIGVRRAAAEAIRPLLPPAGWLFSAIDARAPFVVAEALVREWKAPRGTAPA